MTSQMAIKELIPPSAYSAAAAAKEHHALIKSPAWPCDDQKLSVHWRRKTGIQE